MASSAAYPYCIATIVTQKAIEAMLEVSGEGHYRDEHPWLIAADLWQQAQTAAQRMPVLFASIPDQGEAVFSHWSVIRNIDVVQLHRGQWDTRCTFDKLQPVNPIWEPLDSVFVKASAEQMEREAREGIRVSRHALDEHHVHPYAICETPAFIVEVMSGEG